MTSTYPTRFGESKPIEQGHATSIGKRLLNTRKSDKQFFISPPPSPPLGWESREEVLPNTEVDAEDLAEALQRLNTKSESVTTTNETSGTTNVEGSHHSGNDGDSRGGSAGSYVSNLASGRRSSNILLYDPQESGHSPDLPTIAVEDLTVEADIIAADGLDAEKSM